MSDSQSPHEQRLLDGTFGYAVLGVAFLIVGIGLAAALVTGSLALFGVVLGSTAVLVVLAVVLDVAHDGLSTGENGILALCVLSALVLLFGLSEYTALPHEAVLVLVVVVGVLLPQAILRLLDDGEPRVND